MKLSRHAFVTFWDVHAWGGAVISLIVYAMFVGGTFAVFYQPLKAWQDPPPVAVDRATIDAAVARLVEERGLTSIDVALPDGPVAPPSPSGAADVLYHLHFLYHEDFPIGFQIAGLFGVAYLLMLVTGVLIHLKDLRRQLVRFRPHERRRTLWSDLHKVLGVWGLPFQAMIALTGAVMCLAVVVTPHAARPALGDDARGAAELYGDFAPPPPSGRTAPMLPVTELAARAQAAVPGLDATWIRVAPYGDEAAHALVYGDRAGALGSRVLVRVRARDGAIVATADGGAPAQAVMKVLTGLHVAAYGGLGLRLVYVLLGIGGCMTILTGNWIWMSRRRNGGALARLTVGVGAGMPIAIAAMLWVNRLLPASAARAAAEAWTLFAALGVVVAGALLVPPTRRTWAALLGVAGAGFAAIPVLSALTRPAHLFNGGGALGWRVAGVDLGLALLGALLGAIAAALARRRPGSLR